MHGGRDDVLFAGSKYETQTERRSDMRTRYPWTQGLPDNGLIRIRCGEGAAGQAAGRRARAAAVKWARDNGYAVRSRVHTEPPEVVVYAQFREHGQSGEWAEVIELATGQEMGECLCTHGRSAGREDAVIIGGRLGERGPLSRADQEAGVVRMGGGLVGAEIANERDRVRREYAQALRLIGLDEAEIDAKVEERYGW